MTNPYYAPFTAADGTTRRPLFGPDGRITDHEPRFVMNGRDYQLIYRNRRCDFAWSASKDYWFHELDVEERSALALSRVAAMKWLANTASKSENTAAWAKANCVLLAQSEDSLVNSTIHSTADALGIPH